MKITNNFVEIFLHNSWVPLQKFDVRGVRVGQNNFVVNFRRKWSSAWVDRNEF